jgi:cytochrome c oxidase cbb3-type subunit 3/ubiquinol-cytochrome c reductase cytochrome c subunit
MSAWGVEWGGPLSDDDLDAMVAHIRAWETREPVQTDAIVVDGEVDRGQDIYDVYCLTCHGPDGNGGTYMSLSNPVFLATANDGFLREAIEHGRSQTPMQPYGNQLTYQQIDDLVVLIRSWQVDVAAPPSELPSKTLEAPLLNPEGPEPTFPLEGRYISTEELAAAYEEGAAMVLADARPPSDYVLGHISGAVSVPFFEVENYLEQLPKDRWIVAYCACPHAESGVVADALEAEGFSQVKVLNEGYDDWVEKGHPITPGAQP